MRPRLELSILSVAFLLGAPMTTWATPSVVHVASSSGMQRCAVLLTIDGAPTNDDERWAFILNKTHGLSCRAATPIAIKAIRYYDQGCQMGTCVPQSKMLGKWRCSATSRPHAVVRYTCRQGRRWVEYESRPSNAG